MLHGLFRLFVPVFEECYMKKNFFFLVLIVMAAVLPAVGDSVWMPMDDYFMDTWNPDSDNTCEFQDRPFYLAAGEKGYVTSVKTPLDHTELNTYPNGTEFKIAFVCGSGRNLWGAIEAVRMNGETMFREDWGGTSGYIAFDDLARAYDSEAFAEVHAAEIHPFDEKDFDFCAGNEFVLWKAPNTGVQVEYVYEGYISYLCMDHDPETDFKMFWFGGSYVDPDGNRWVEVTIRRDTEHGWVNLDHLTDGGVKPEY